jgi:hypothetical protein
MRNRRRHRPDKERVDATEWPDAALDVDDEDFARAIAEGRAAEAA